MCRIILCCMAVAGSGIAGSKTQMSTACLAGEDGRTQLAMDMIGMMGKGLLSTAIHTHGWSKVY